MAPITHSDSVDALVPGAFIVGFATSRVAPRRGYCVGTPLPPLFERVPPALYCGTERVVSWRGGPPWIRSAPRRPTNDGLRGLRAGLAMLPAPGALPKGKTYRATPRRGAKAPAKSAAAWPFGEPRVGHASCSS
jgi:hypothetical protein